MDWKLNPENSLSLWLEARHLFRMVLRGQILVIFCLSPRTRPIGSQEGVHESQIVLLSLSCTLFSLWWPAKECEITWVITTRGITHIYWNVHSKVYAILYVSYGQWGRIWSETKRIIFAIRRTILVPGVCPCIRIRSIYDALCAHRRGHGDKHKNWHFLLVTTKLIVPSGQYICIWNIRPIGSQEGVYASETVSVSLAWTLGSPWWPETQCEITRVITTRRITLVLECTYTSICNIIMCHMNTGENFEWWQNALFFIDIKKNILGPGVRLCILIWALMHHMHTGEATVTSDKLGHFFPCHHEAYSRLRTVCMNPKLCWWVWHGHWAALGDQQRGVKSPEWSPQGVLHLYWNVHTNVYAVLCVIWTLGRIFDWWQNISFCYQKDRTSSRSVSIHLTWAMMYHRHTGEAVVTSKKLTFFCLSPQGLQHFQDGVYAVWCGHRAAFDDQQRNMKLPEWSPQGVLHLYSNVHAKVYAYTWSPARKWVALYITKTLDMRGCF